MFKLEFVTEDKDFATEAAAIKRVLRIIANDLDNGETEGIAKDSNGNYIGSWEIA